MTTALAEYMGTADTLLSLSDWIEEKNVHNWQPTGQSVLDNLTEIFRSKYLGKKWSIDDFVQVPTAAKSFSAIAAITLKIN